MRKSTWRGFFRFTRGTYRPQHAARTIRAIASGNPGRVLKLYTRCGAYKIFARAVNASLR